MSKFELKDRSGFIFKNDYKTEEKHPHYKGQIKWKDELIDIALYVNKKDHKTYFGAVLQEPYVKDETPQKSDSEEIGSDLPF